jgi:signal transduction histidine kinase
MIIQDNGCGISTEHIANIFDPFITYKKNGTGLGLAIASRIIKAHHGTIQVSSDLGVGTTFTLSLPIEQNT